VRLKDGESSSFGAEALPGGLREINAARGSESAAADAAPPGARRTPVVGLIALVTRYLGWDTTRR